MDLVIVYYSSNFYKIYFATCSYLYNLLTDFATLLMECVSNEVFDSLFSLFNDFESFDFNYNFNNVTDFQRFYYESISVTLNIFTTFSKIFQYFFTIFIDNPSNQTNQLQVYNFSPSDIYQLKLLFTRWIGNLRDNWYQEYNGTLQEKTIMNESFIEFQSFTKNVKNFHNLLCNFLDTWIRYTYNINYINQSIIQNSIEFLSKANNILNPLKLNIENLKQFSLKKL